MSYATERDAFGRQVQWLIEIDLDRCDEVYSQAPCTATYQRDGLRCWYTWPTCQDPANFNRTTRTLRFCLNHVPWPDNTEQVYPLLRSMVSVPQRVQPGSLEVFPQRLDMKFLYDYGTAAPDTDKGYTDTTEYDGTANGSTSWTNPAQAYDGNDGTAATLAGSASSEVLTITTFGSGTLKKARASILFNMTGATSEYSAEYSTDGGSSWVEFASGTGGIGGATWFYGATLNDVDISQYQVRITCSTALAGSASWYEAPLIEQSAAYNEGRDPQEVLTVAEGPSSSAKLVDYRRPTANAVSGGWTNGANAYDDETSPGATYASQTSASAQTITFSGFGAGRVKDALLYLDHRAISGGKHEYSTDGGATWTVCATGLSGTLQIQYSYGITGWVSLELFRVRVTDTKPSKTEPRLYDVRLLGTRDRGEFWRNLLARNPNYIGRKVRIKRGFNASGFALADFQQVGPEYNLTRVRRDKDGVIVSAESPLAKLDKKAVPASISEDNTIQNAGGINAAVTSVTVRDASEFPDPADYSRFNLYVKIESEICKYTNRNTTTNVLTIQRGSLNTTAASHAQDTKVRHVALFGVDNGISTDPGPQMLSDTIQDLLEWMEIDAADVDTASFTELDAVWPDEDVYRLLEKPEKVSKILGKIRTTRSCILYINVDSQWSVAAYNSGAAASFEATEDDIIEDSIEIMEDEEERITRVGLWYDPNTDNPGSDPADYDRAVYVIDANLEDVKLFGEKQERIVADAWVYPTLAVAKVRNIARRLISRLRYGERTVKVQLELKESDTLHVGDVITVSSRLVTNIAGAPDTRTLLLLSRDDVSENRTEYVGVDTGYAGRFLRIAPDTVSDTYDLASPEDRQYGYWGDANNRVGTGKQLGYIFW